MERTRSTRQEEKAKKIEEDKEGRRMKKRMG